MKENEYGKLIQIKNKQFNNLLNRNNNKNILKLLVILNYYIFKLPL